MLAYVTAGCAVVSALAWMYLLTAHGQFWRLRERLDESSTPARNLSAPVVVLVPARNEAENIARTLRALLNQSYAGPVEIVVIDDDSEDDTRAIIDAISIAAPSLSLALSPPLPPGWVGKMWALQTGLRRIERFSAIGRPKYLLLTDADLELHENTLAHLVAKAEAHNFQLTSLMVRLSHAGGWPRLLVPAFVYFFQMLYPFARVNDPRSRVAAAAGGCMLVRLEALERTGGIAAIKDRIIDDCALAAQLKGTGSIWLALATHSRSIRPYEDLRSIWHTVTRSAFVQLKHSIALLALTTIGLGLLYIVPWLAIMLAASSIAGAALLGMLGALAFALSALTFVPMLRFYGQSGWLAAALPIAGCLYLAMTWHSAIRHICGKGVQWRGRTHR